MSLRNIQIFKSLFLFAIVISFVGCGYQPLHGKRKTAQDISIQKELSSVWVETIEDREGQMLHNELLTLFNTKGQPRAPKYKLKVTYNESSSSLGIGKDDFATRANLVANANFTLSGTSDINATSQSVVSYNILTSPTGTEFAKRDARNRAIKNIAKDIYRRVTVHLLSVKEQADGVKK